MKGSRLVATLLATLLAGAGLVVGAGPALAWQASQDASATCVYGSVVITGTFTNSEPAGGGSGEESRDMSVIMHTDYGSTDAQVVAIQDTGTFVLDTGKTTIPAGQVTFESTWADGHEGSDESTATYDAAGCQPVQEPGTPSVDITHSCRIDAFEVTFGHRGGADDITYRVEQDGTTVDTLTLKKGDADVVRQYHVAEDATSQIKVFVGNDVVASDSWHRDCYRPGTAFVEVKHSCAIGGFQVTLGNHGDDRIKYFKVIQDGKVDKIQIKPGGADVVKVYPVAEDTTSTIEVWIGSFKKASDTFQRNCEVPGTPRTSITHSCDLGGFQATFGNDGGTEPVTYTVKQDGTTVDTVTVQPGGSDIVKNYPVAEDTTSTLKIYVGSTEKASDTFARDCSLPGTPRSSVRHSCALGGFHVRLGNKGGNQPVTYTVKKDGVTVDTITVKSGAKDVVKTYKVAEDTTSTLKVYAGGKLTASDTFNRNCTEVKGVKHPHKPPTKVEGTKLPHTGADVTGLVVGGTGLITLGVLLLLAGTTTRRREV